MRNFLSVVAFLSFVLWSCVDIPESAPPLPDPQTLTRYMHLASGVDTIGLFHKTSTTTTKTGQRDTIVSGSDVVYRSDSQSVIVSKISYKRYEVDFSSTMQLSVDGVLLGSLSFSDATSYRNIPSGNRAIHIGMVGTHLDTIEHVETITNQTVTRDTVGKGKFSSTISDTAASTTSFVVASPFNELVIADSTTPSLLHASFEKATVFLIKRSEPLFSELNGIVRYGFMRFEFGWERRSFTPSPSDSFAVRFVNVTKGSAGKKLTIRGIASNDTTTPVTRSIDSVETDVIGGYQKFYNGVYSFYVSQGGTTAYKDSLPQLLMPGGRRITLAVIANDSSFNFRKYDDD